VNDVIELRDLRCEVIVGVLPDERHTPQPVSMDIDVERPFARAAATDDLAATTNYAEIVSLAVTTATDGKFLLLETLAYAVAQATLDCDDNIAAATVSAKKLRPPVPESVATVGVRCTLRREP
jgi:7,8-dihydroneopterin aldolase/epimerase/oxygenase